MGREIRSVPLDWKHPTDANGHYIPLLDQSYREAMDEWSTVYPDEDEPDPADYRPDWDESTATAYQVYETVTEGTPVSPVFATTSELRAWLLGQGHSEYASDEFIKRKWAPSMVISGGFLAMNIDSFDL